MLAMLALLALSGAAGCAGPRVTAGTTTPTPTAPALEPRNAIGQELEDLFFPYATSMNRFDMDAALDEGGGGYGSEYYDETAGGAYYDETAAGDEDQQRLALDDSLALLRTLEQQLTRLEQGLAAESHPLAGTLAELRDGVSEVLASPEDYPEVTSLLDVRSTIAPQLFEAVESYVAVEAPRSRDATDCSLAAIALYGALYDTIVEVMVDSHVTLNSYVSDQEEWRAEQQEQLGGVAAIIEWLDRHPTLPAEPWDQLDELSRISEPLYDIESYLTPGTEPAVTAAWDILSEAESPEDVRAALTALRAAVTATLANVQSPPYQAEIAAYEAIPERLERALGQLPSPGPRAALRVLRSRGLNAQFEVIEVSPDQLTETVRWARVACEGASPD